MIEFVRYQSSNYNVAKMLVVSESQLPYVGEVADILAYDSPVNHVYLIKNGGVVVGVFIIDTAYAEHYKFALAGEVGLRGFVIDLAQQGQGLGVRSVRLLRTFLLENYLNASSMVLTVNCRNKAAYHCYIKGGFIDNAELYHGGRAGPQHILRLELK